jgi:iron complex outermembrane recepter protein
MPAQGNTEKLHCHTVLQIFINMKAFLLLAGIFLSLPAISQLNISGKVTDSQGKPLSGANITLKGGFPGAVTNESGEYGIPGLSGGSYTITATFVGFTPQERHISVNTDTECDFQLEHSVIMIDEAIVTSSRAGKKDPVALSEISRDELGRSNLSQDIPMLLSATPSLVVSSDAGTGIGYTGFRVRGTDANRINITVDGIPLNDAESHSVYFVDLPDFASSTENIQVQRGVGTSQNGASAFGASVNFQTLPSGREAHSELSTVFGSFNTRRNSLSLGTGLLGNHFTLDARLSGISSDGYIDRASSALSSYFISAGWYGAKTMLKLNLISGKEKTYQAWDGVPGYLLTSHRSYNGLGKYTDEYGNEQYYENQTDNYQQDHYRLHFRRDITRDINLNAAIHFTQGEGYYEEYKEDQDLSLYRIAGNVSDSALLASSDLIRQKWLDNDFYGAMLSSNIKKDNISATVGGAWNRYKGEHFGKVIWSRYSGLAETGHKWYSSDATKQDYNLFAKLNYALGENLSLYWDFQVRGIDYVIEGEDDDHRDISQNHKYFFFNPKTGVNYSNSKGHRAYFSFSVANREPNRDNFVDADTTMPAPGFETLNDYEVGYSFSGKTFTAGANIYYMDYNNQLVLTGEINDVGSAVMSNVKDSYRTGIEFTAGMKKDGLFSWNMALTLSSSKINNFTAYVDNWSYWDDPANQSKQLSFDLGKTDIAFSPGIIASSNFRYFFTKEMDVDLVSKYVGSQYIDNTASESRKLDPWFVNDIKMEYRFHPPFLKELVMDVTVNNIFNYQYSSNAWVYRYFQDGKEGLYDGYFPQAGVNFLAGIRAGF